MRLSIAPKQLVLILAGWAIAVSAAAQWQWLDKDGRKVFSDRPPPAETKDRDILKQPGNRARSNASPANAEADPAAPAAVAVVPAAKTNAPKLSGKDSELEAKKKKLEEEETAKKKVEEEKLILAKADNCARARKGLASLQSGVRISIVNAKGEREFMDDNTRANENKHLQTIVDSDCK